MKYKVKYKNKYGKISNFISYDNVDKFTYDRIAHSIGNQFYRELNRLYSDISYIKVRRCRKENLFI